MGSSRVFLKLRQGADEQIKHIEGEIARTVVKYRENTEAAIVIIALVRVARMLLKKYPQKTKVLLRNELCDFLEEKVDDSQSPIITLGRPN